MSWWMVSKFPHCQGYSCCSCIFNPSTILGLLLLNLSTCTWPELSERRIIHHLHAIWKGTIFRKDITEKRSVVQSPHSMLTQPLVLEFAIAMVSLPAFFSWVQKLAQTCKFQEEFPNIPCLLGKKLPNCQKRRNTKTIHHILGLGFLSLLKNKLKFFGYVLKTCGHLMVNPSWDGYNWYNLTNL